MSIPSTNVAPVLIAKEAIAAERPVVSDTPNSANPSPKFPPSGGQFGGKGAEFGGKDESRPRSRPYKARMATKVKWALGDTMEKTISAQRKMRSILGWLEEQMVIDEGDEPRLARLGELGHFLFGLALDVSEMERIVTGAIAESRPGTDSKNHDDC